MRKVLLAVENSDVRYCFVLRRSTYSKKKLTSVNVRDPLLPKSLKKNRDWFHPEFTEIKTTNKPCKMKSKAWFWLIVMCELPSSYYCFTLYILHLAGQLLCGRYYVCVKRCINSVFVYLVSIHLNPVSLA